MVLTTFKCPRCGQRSKANLRPLGRYPWPPRYVCLKCDDDLGVELEAKETPEPSPGDSQRPQRQLGLFKDKDDEETPSG